MGGKWKSGHFAPSGIDWYEDYFLADAAKDFRGGALRQLHDRIEMIRNGDFEPRLPRGTELYPVLVTFDTLCENPLLYRWIVDLCSTKGLLNGDGVRPVTLANVADYEALLACAVSGNPITRLLKERSGRWRNRRLDLQLFDADCPRRLPEMERIYSDCTGNMLEGFSAALRANAKQNALD
ncbi:MAG: hypothetical protein JRD92_14435 [Deltaproteobacteria bacterium]|nr:hypothetical protein [Deltaproteobacteria bacterium]MBW2588124.1 hypothetical protein [Deltaproteobacteria bacterium]